MIEDLYSVVVGILGVIVTIVTVRLAYRVFSIALQVYLIYSFICTVYTTSKIYNEHSDSINTIFKTFKIVVDWYYA